MREKVFSSTMKRYYYPDECMRIVNNLQAASYWVNGCVPVDIYPSRDRKTGKPITVYVFNREESKGYYERWEAHALN